MNYRNNGAFDLRPNFCMLKAFTLAELLMAVLVISIIMVALAPVITKRVYDNIDVEITGKKGLEIYTNPGVYAFDVPMGIETLFIQGAGGGGGGGGASYIDKEISFEANANWTIPQGVNQVTFTITGAGGGGGAANAKSNTNIKTNSCNSDDNLLIRFASDERDLCITKNNIASGIKPADGTAAPDGVLLDAGQECSGGRCCWKSNGAKNCTNGNEGHCNYNRGDSKATGNTRPICQGRRASDVCSAWYSNGNVANQGQYRLPNLTELKKMFSAVENEGYEAYKPTMLNLCVYNYEAATGEAYASYRVTSVAQCYATTKCVGAERGNYCAPFQLWGVDYQSKLAWDSGKNGENMRLYDSNPENVAASVRCVKPISKYTRYSGAGGASGAQMTKTINVLPSDIFEITVGKGGAGGKYNIASASGAKGYGNRGGTTQIIHKRNGAEIGRYYVKGGYGGKGASGSTNGAVWQNGTAEGQTTPSISTNDTCFAAGGSRNCTEISYSGEAGTGTKGGNGGRVANTGIAASGGTLYKDPARKIAQRNTPEEANKAKGQNATEAGFGGGGGLTPAWANSTTHFHQGGNGANGKIEITYRVTLPGGGGASGARVAGIVDDNKDFEIKYKVKQGSRIVVRVGSGGSGGNAFSDGMNGEATIIGSNDIVFLGGEGGKASSEAQKNALEGGFGGRKSCVNQDGTVVSSSLGLIIVAADKIKYSHMAPQEGFGGENGSKGQLKNGSNWLNYGFDGGIGGAPYGIGASFLNAARTCGGGTKGASNTSANCPNGTIDGSRALSHDPVNNQLGGSGGGGGGAAKDILNIGSGGSGSSGYLRIRWSEAENEQW